MLFYVYRIEEKDEDFMVFEVYHNGEFIGHPFPLSYDYPNILVLKVSRSKRMSFKDFCDLLVYKLECKIWSLFYCIPRRSLEKGLTIVETDAEIKKMYDVASSYGLLQLYIAHDPQNLAQYYYNNLPFDSSDDEVISRLKSHEKRKGDAASMSPEQLEAWAEEESRSPYLRTPPLKARRKGIHFQGKNLFEDFLHSSSVGDELDGPPGWLEGAIDEKGWVDVGATNVLDPWLDLALGYDVDTLPDVGENGFANDVVLDVGGSNAPDIGASSSKTGETGSSLGVPLMQKGKKTVRPNTVNFNRKRLCFRKGNSIWATKGLRRKLLRGRVLKRLATARRCGSLTSLFGLNDDQVQDNGPCVSPK